MSASLTVEKLEDIPLDVLSLIEGAKGGVAEVAELLELEFPNLVMPRKLIRQVVRQQVFETEQDVAALNPTSLDPLMGTIDRALNKEIQRIANRIETLSEIASEAPGKICTIDRTGEELTPADAREELVSLRGIILEMKKSLVEQRKADSAANAGVNVNVDLGSVVSAALENVKRMELPVEAREINAG
jgi:hypothetical protein